MLPNSTFIAWAEKNGKGWFQVPNFYVAILVNYLFGILAELIFWIFNKDFMENVMRFIAGDSENNYITLLWTQ